MRRRAPLGPPIEMPADLRVFNPEEWRKHGPDCLDIEPGQLPARGEFPCRWCEPDESARRHWSDARMVWARAHGLTPLDLLRQDHALHQAQLELRRQEDAR